MLELKCNGINVSARKHCFVKLLKKLIFKPWRNEIYTYVPATLAMERPRPIEE